MRIRNRVSIEFIKATGKRAVGDRLAVDPMSATSFCDKLKVAVRVGADAKPVKKAAKPAAAPEVAESEPVPPADFGDDDTAA